MLDSKLNLMMTDCMAEDSVGREEEEKEKGRERRHTDRQSDRDGGEGEGGRRGKGRRGWIKREGGAGRERERKREVT